MIALVRFSHVSVGLGLALMCAVACGSGDKRKSTHGAGGSGGTSSTSAGEAGGVGGTTTTTTTSGPSTATTGADGGSGGTTETSNTTATTGMGGAAGEPGSDGQGLGGTAGADAGGQAGAAGAAIDPACEEISETASLTAYLKITADNECEVFVNGSSVGVTTSWQAPVTIDVSLSVYPGIENVIAIRGTNTSSQDGNDRGIVGELTIEGDEGVEALIVTDASWRVATTEEPGWTSQSFDDSSWIFAAEVAEHGDGPWGTILTTTTPKWIWSAPIPYSTSEKPNLETTYARKAFYFDTEGSLSNEPGCP